MARYPGGVHQIVKVQSLHGMDQMSRKPRILIVTEAGDAYPSGKIRAYIFKDFFAKQEYIVTYKNCMNPFIVKLYANKNVAVLFLKRLGVIALLNKFNVIVIKKINIFFILLNAKHYDVVFLQKVFSWFLVQKVLKNKHLKLVYDLNDGLWLPAWHRVTEGKINNILAAAHAVTCDNPYGLSYAQQYNKNCYLIPDSPQIELFDTYRYSNVKTNKESIVLGWVGSPSTLFNIYAIWEPLEYIFSKYNHIHLRIIGGGKDLNMLPLFENVRFSVVPFYSQEELIKEVLNMDIGLFPLFENENSKARGVLKATVYMSGEVAVVSSAVGQSVDLIQDGVNGMLASTHKEWQDKLEALIVNTNLRKEIAKKGMETVRENYTIEKNFQKLVNVFT